MSDAAGRPSPDHRGELWECPKCGAKFVNRNQWHSCGLATVEDWLRDRGTHARRLYEKFESMVAACGEYHVAPAKSRIAFLGRVRFAGVTRLTDRNMTCNFSLPERLESARFHRVWEVVPGWFVHELRIEHPDQLDEEVQGWLRRSYRLMGMQERLRHK